MGKQKEFPHDDTEGDPGRWAHYARFALWARPIRCPCL